MLDLAYNFALTAALISMWGLANVALAVMVRFFRNCWRLIVEADR